MKTMCCRKCGKQHDLFYLRDIGGNLSLCYKCPTHRECIWAPMIRNLDIPIEDSKKLARAKAQPTFDLGV